MPRQINVPLLARVQACCAILASFIVAGLMPGVARAAPQTFNTALPVAKGAFIFREQVFYEDMKDDRVSDDRDFRVIGSVSVLGYGIAEDWAAFVALPILDKDFEVASSAGPRFSRGTRGIGDLQLFGRYTAYRDDAPGRTFRIAPFAGIKVPTGDDDERDQLGRLPQAVQLGSGSWDPFLGIIVTWQTLDHQIDAQLAYRANTEHDGFAFGDELRFDASIQHRLWPRELGAGVPGFLYGVLEANLIHQDKNRLDGIDDPNSGGTTFLLAPGLQYVTKRWVIEAIVQLPVAQDLNGTALEQRFTVLAGFRVNL